MSSEIETVAIALHDSVGPCMESTMKRMYGPEEGERRHREYHSSDAGLVLVALDSAGVVVHAKDVPALRKITDESVVDWLREALDVDTTRTRLDAVTISELRRALDDRNAHLLVLRGLIHEAASAAMEHRTSTRVRSAVKAADDYVNADVEEAV